MTNKGRVILASVSPRRRMLLEAACLEVEVRPSGADESWPGGELAEGAIALALRKLSAIKASNEIIIAADTIVALDQNRFEKPTDNEDAIRMLTVLAGKTHEVYTGYCVSKNHQIIKGVERTLVSFRNLSAAEIKQYVRTGESLDKAGSYGIQGVGGSLIHRIEGSYTNVMGLPLKEVLSAIEDVS
ncbi:MAG: septum formation protein Maf [Deltaproteobacteria bacterium]|nr:septum formation protein Maf [Deltaproteobacteria bacterium]